MNQPKHPRCAVGNRYGRLTVIELIPGGKNTLARCVCDCGGQVDRQRSALVRGAATSCGCIAKESSPLKALLEVIKAQTDECVETPTCRLAPGYGTVRYNGRNERAHRISYAHSNGLAVADLAGVHIMHTCDNPPCVNPRHLQAGTHLDNMRDMFSKGRRIAAVGERASSSKLTALQVLEIRMRSAAGERDSSLAKRFSLSKTTVRAIRIRKTWRHI